EIEAEQRKRLDRRATADHHLRPAFGQEIERREFLEQPDRVGRAQHRHRAGEPDALRARGRRPEDDGRSRVQEFAAMVLADAERSEPEPIGVLDLLDPIAQPVGGADHAAVVGEGRGEAVDADFHATSCSYRDARRSSRLWGPAPKWATSNAAPSRPRFFMNMAYCTCAIIGSCTAQKACMVSV